MSQETAATPVETPAPAPPAPPKSWTKILRDSEKNELQCIAVVRKDGTVYAYVTERHVQPGEGDKAGKLVTAYTKKGASKEFASMDEAKNYLGEVLKAALKAGWKAGAAPGSGGAGFKAKADQFDLSNLPAPAGSPKAKK